MAADGPIKYGTSAWCHVSKSVIQSRWGVVSTSELTQGEKNKNAPGLLEYIKKKTFKKLLRK